MPFDVGVGDGVGEGVVQGVGDGVGDALEDADDDGEALDELPGCDMEYARRVVPLLVVTTAGAT